MDPAPASDVGAVDSFSYDGVRFVIQAVKAEQAFHLIPVCF